ncbi:MAG: hydrolase [Ruminococcaceae bacterium]|nr:hydrolase [Oscillospiraceae bacterium]
MEVELIIASPGGDVIYLPAAEEGIEWTTQRRSTPGKLVFSVVNDDILSFSEGSTVRLTVDGNKVFYGFVFTQKRDKNGIIEVTAYDQLRYLSNKDTYVYENKTASELLQMIASDFELKTGDVEDTGFKIASRVEENSSLFDMLENALDLTLQNSKKMFVLYDDFGKLALKNVSSMLVKKDSGYLLIDEESGENFEYSSSIDSDTYNKIKLTYDNEDTGKREVYIAQDSGNINNWGILQYYDTLKEGENGQAKAEALLKQYNAKTRKLRITNAFGDCSVRAGSMVAVRLDLGDMTVNNFMLVEKATHTFKLDEHFMDLTLKGGEFNV